MNILKPFKYGVEQLYTVHKKHYARTHNKTTGSNKQFLHGKYTLKNF